MDSSECFYHCSNRIAGRIFCIAGGFVDTAGYLLLKSIFTASITGNLVKIVYVTAESHTVTCFIIVTIFYGVGSAIVRFMSIFLRTYDKVDNLIVGMLALLLEVILLLVSIFVGNYLKDDIVRGDVNSTPVIIVATIIATAMGAQVGAAAVAISGFPNTTGMTASVATSLSAAMNLTLVYLQKISCVNFYLSIQDIKKLEESDELFDKARSYLLLERSEAAWEELDKQCWPLVYFVGGAALGAYMASNFHYNCLFLPIGIIMVFIIEMALKKWWKYKSPKSSEKVEDVIEEAVTNDSRHSHRIFIGRLKSIDVAMSTLANNDNNAHSDNGSSSSNGIKSRTNSVSRVNYADYEI